MNKDNLDPKTETIAETESYLAWKAEEPAQQLILKHMDPQTRQLMEKVHSALDPNGIMNPGNWEVR